MALKVLNADPSSEAGELRFIREIRMLARLQHPNILPLHDSGYVEALLYYLMPYVSGETDLPMRTICPASGDSFQLPRFFPRRSQPQLAQWSWRLTSPIGECERALERSKQVYVGPTTISWIYANLDEPDAAFD